MRKMKDEIVSAIMMAINESFDIDDMDNVISDEPAAKRKV